MAEHGTYAGWNQHHYKGEPPCPQCREAATEYVAWRRFLTDKQRDPRRCKKCGSVFREHQCHAPSATH